MLTITNKKLPDPRLILTPKIITASPIPCMTVCRIESGILVKSLPNKAPTMMAPAFTRVPNKITCVSSYRYLTKTPMLSL